MTEKVKNIHERILNVMAELDYIAKGDNKVMGQYRFVSHDQVSAKVHPFLVKHRITAIPTVEGIDQDGNKTILRVRTDFTNVDDPNDKLSVVTFGYGIDPGDKGPGKAISYAFKIALLKTFCLETGEDPDYDQNAVHEPKKCLEFNATLPSGFTEEAVSDFIEEISKTTKKHKEDIKREAVKKMPEFIDSFNKWANRKKSK